MSSDLCTERGVFILSLDTELAGAWTGNRRLPRLLPQFEQVRQVVRRLLSLFETYDIPATWAIMGALFKRADRLAGPLDLGGRLLAGGDIVESVMRSPVPHEIASHSFAHPFFDEIDQSEAETDLGRAISIAREWGLELKSFVFPANRVAHLEVLSRLGFIAFRGPDRTWFERCPQMTHRIFRGIDLLLGLSPIPTYPELYGDLLVNLPGSMLFRVPSWGIARFAPVAGLAARARAGIRRASREKAVFHLWFHPFNFAFKGQAHFAALEKTLKLAASFRSQGSIEIVTMGGLATRILRRSRDESALLRNGSSDRGQSH